MKRQLHIIALRTVRHNERSSIFTAYSLEAGRVSFAIPAGNGREASRRRALLMPLGLVECVADIRPGREIHMMSDPRAEEPLTGLRTHPAKSAVAMFMAEVLSIVLRDGPADEGLYRYIYKCVKLLDVLPGSHVANFHLCFLYGLGSYLGIEPDVTDYREGMVFDMIDGRFRMSAPMHRHFLDSRRAQSVVALSRMTMVNMHLFGMTRDQRNEMLDGILDYYTLHYAGLNAMRSLEVLRELGDG